jgi:competence protein ComEC
VTDRETLSLAVLAGLAALAAQPVVPAVLVCAGLAAVASRHRWLVALAIVLVVSHRAHGALDGLRPPETQTQSGTVTVMSDPRRQPGRWSFEARAVDGRYLATLPASSGAAPVVGETLEVTGTVSPLRPSAWARARHLRGRWSIHEVTDRRPPSGPLGWANGVRGLIRRGTASLEAHRPLFDGLVFGDDTEQSPELRARFRASGLSHLLAVSGQNVAFVLLVAAPALTRLPLAGRWALTLVVLAGFTLVTRWEPSVLRAVAMAAVAATAGWRGRYASGPRRLAVAVIGCLAVDPLLVWSAGFRLSVAACGGLVWWQARITSALGAPRPVASACAAMLAAQAATAPLLMSMGDRLSVSAIPANLVAVPVAGWVMVWGLAAGVPAGLVGEPIATLIHQPTRLMCRFLEWVATWGADPRWPRLGPVGLGVVAGGTLWWAATRRRSRWLASGGVAALVIFGAIVGWARSPGPEIFEVPGALVARHGGVVVVLDGAADPSRLVGELAERSVTRIDLLVVTSAGRRTAAQVHFLGSMIEVRTTLAPEGRIASSVPLHPGRLTVGGVTVEVSRNGSRWSARTSV